MRYLLLNKPYEVLTQFTDEHGRATLKDFVAVPGVYPVGRLDFDSEGLLLLTDDKQLQHRLSDPRYKVPKTYWAQVEGTPTEAALQHLREGVQIKEGFTLPAEAQALPEAATADLWPRTPPIRYRASIPTAWLAITISQGMNRQVRKMCAAVDLPCLRLVRVALGTLPLDGLAPGQWRDLTATETAAPARAGGRGQPQHAAVSAHSCHHYRPARAAPASLLMLRRLGWFLVVLFGLLNVLVAFHAWRFTHFSAEPGPRIRHPERLPTSQKIRLLFTGFQNPKPVNLAPPAFPYENVALRSSNGQLAAWYGAVPAARGTVILCHGYTSDKSRLRTEAAYFRQLGYAVLLFDFSGNGASQGYQTTIGYREAADVVAAYQWAQARQPGAPIVLYGVSMGAVALLRAESELGLRPAANIIECPYGSMLQTAQNRFRSMHLPTFPLANMLVFWGGVENGYWAFGLKAEEYARHVSTPTLLLWGTADPRVTRAETDSIFAHLAGPKQRHYFAGLGHEPYWHRQPTVWRRVVQRFLQVPR